MNAIFLMIEMITNINQRMIIITSLDIINTKTLITMVIARDSIQRENESEVRRPSNLVQTHLRRTEVVSFLRSCEHSCPYASVQSVVHRHSGLPRHQLVPPPPQSLIFFEIGMKTNLGGHEMTPKPGPFIDRVGCIFVRVNAHH